MTRETPQVTQQGTMSPENVPPDAESLPAEAEAPIPRFGQGRSHDLHPEEEGAKHVKLQPQAESDALHKQEYKVLRDSIK